MAANISASQASTSSSSSPTFGPDPPPPQGPPEDLSDEKPNQVKYPSRFYNGKKLLFVSTWRHWRDWLEYSVKTDSAFSYPRKFWSTTAYTYVDSVFITKGNCKWKLASESNKGFHKHVTSKEHLTCDASWSFMLCRLKKQLVTFLMCVACFLISSGSPQFQDSDFLNAVVRS